MKRPNLTLALCFTFGLVIAAQINAQDLSKVFGAKGGNGDARPQSTAGYSPADLQDFVHSMDFTEVEQLDDSTWDFDYRYAQQNFPTTLYLTESRRILWCSYRLAQLPENIGNDYFPQILHLLELNGGYGDFFFHYDAQTRMIKLSGAIQIDNQMHNEEIVNQLNTMADIALTTWDQWDPNSWIAARSNQQLGGTWIAEDYGLTLIVNGSNRFELQNGDQPTTGQFAIEGDRLIMQDDQAGERVEGQIRFDSDTRFTFTVNGNKIVFVRS